MNTIKVAIVEDNQEVAQMLKQIINTSPELEVISIFHNAEDAIHFSQLRHPDIMIIDIGLPRASGIEVIKELSNYCPKTQYCVFTVYEDDDKIFSALDAGAKGYILKNSEKSKIIQAITELYQGGAPMSPYIARRVIDKFSLQKGGEQEVPLELLPISEREAELLNLLAKGHSYKEIGEILFISSGTVKQHLHNIYSKLHVTNKTQAINKYLNNQ